MASIYTYLHIKVFIYYHLNIICITAGVTFNMIIVSSYEVSVIAKWIRHPHLVRAVAGSPLAVDGKFFTCGEYVLRKICVSSSNTGTYV